MIGILVVGGIVIAVFAISAEVRSEGQSLRWSTVELERTTDNTYLVTGELFNESTGWRVVKPTMDISFMNSAGLVVSERSNVPLNTGDIPSGQSARYAIKLTVFEEFDRHFSSLEWDWKRE